MFNDTFRRVDGPAEALHQHLPLRLGGHADDPVDHVAPFARRAGADLDPGEVPELGDPDGDIAPGTLFEKLPEDWVCPECAEPKDQFIEA